MLPPFVLADSFLIPDENQAGYESERENNG